MRLRVQYGNTCCTVCKVHSRARGTRAGAALAQEPSSLHSNSSSQQAACAKLLIHSAIVCKADLIDVAILAGTGARFAALDFAALEPIPDWKVSLSLPRLPSDGHLTPHTTAMQFAYPGGFCG